MSKIKVICEIAQAHDGSLGILHSYIDAVAKTGADCIKFQTHIAAAESSVHEPFRVNFSYEDKTRMDYWKRMEFSFDQWKEIKSHCEEVDLEFLSSPFSMEALDLLFKLDVDTIKIASGEVSNGLMIEEIAKSKKRIFLSSGMSNYDELDKAVDTIHKYGNQLVIFQCTTSYPTPANRVGLNVIPELMERYGAPVGLSDHSGEIFPALSAVTLGAQYIEVHGVFSKVMFGPDALSSLEMSQLTQLVSGIRFTEEMLKNPVNKNDNSQFGELKNIFEKSLGVRKDMKEGDIISVDCLETKKPKGFGIPASEYKSILGKQLNKALCKFDFLNHSDLV